MLFEPIGWEAALEEVAARLKAIAVRDPQRILPYSYAGTMGLVQGESMAGRFFNRLGAAHLDRTICASAGKTGLAYTLGGPVGMDVERFAESKLIILWGTNSITSNLHFWTFAQQAKRRGAKLVAIDPHRTATAEKCHQHIALLPGTDAALALGMIASLARQGLLDHDYIREHTLGFDALLERARGWTPERVAERLRHRRRRRRCPCRRLRQDRAGGDPAQLRHAAGPRRRQRRPADRGSAGAGRRLAPSGRRHAAVQQRRASPSTGAPCSGRTCAPELPSGTRRRIVNMSTIGDALLEADPPIEALVVYNSNPVAVAPDSSKVIQGFAREDLFTVVLEHFRTDTADYADILLPATTQLEHLDIHTSYGHRYWVMNQPAIQPLGEALPNSEIFRRLARRMGFDEPCFDDSDLVLAAQAIDRQGRTTPAALRARCLPLQRVITRTRRGRRDCPAGAAAGAGLAEDRPAGGTVRRRRLSHALRQGGVLQQPARGRGRRPAAGLPAAVRIGRLRIPSWRRNIRWR